MIRRLGDMTLNKKLREQDFFSLNKRLKISLLTVFIHRMGGGTPNRARLFSEVQTERMKGIQLQ